MIKRLKKRLNPLLDKQLIIKDEGMLRMYDVFLEHIIISQKSMINTC
jgi:hypothetical protein